MKKEKAKKQLLDTYLSTISYQSNLSKKKRKDMVLSIMSNTHSSELLADEEYIYPRGIDFIQEVLIKAQYQYKLLNTKSTKEKKAIFDSLNFSWTKNWLKRTEAWSEVQYKDNFDKDIEYCKFAELYDKNINTLNKLFKNNTELKSFIYRKGKHKYITKEGANLIKSKYYIKEETVRMSDFIGKNFKWLHSEFDFIVLSDVVNNYNKVAKNALTKVYDAEMIVKDSIGNKYYDFLEKVKRFHPHEVLIVSLKDNDEMIHGKKKLTLKGMNYYQHIYLKNMSEEESTYIENDIKWCVGNLKSNNINDYIYEDISLIELSKINKIELPDLLKSLNIFFSNYLFEKNDSIYLNAIGFEKLESEFPIFRLRHLSFVLSSFEMDYVDYKKREIEDTSKDVLEWLEVDDLKIGKIYQGNITNNYSVQGNDSFKKILVINIRPDTISKKIINGKEIEFYQDIKIRIPYILLQEKRVYQLLMANVPITFEIEEINNHKRISWIRLYSNILIKLNWSLYYKDFVEAPKRGRGCH